MPIIITENIYQYKMKLLALKNTVVYTFLKEQKQNRTFKITFLKKNGKRNIVVGICVNYSHFCPNINKNDLLKK